MGKRTAPEIIGIYLSWDINDVKDGRYQPTRYASPSVYVCGEDYFCAPLMSQKPPKDWEWDLVANYYGRDVYRSKPMEKVSAPTSSESNSNDYHFEFDRWYKECYPTDTSSSAIKKMMYKAWKAGLIVGKGV